MRLSTDTNAHPVTGKAQKVPFKALAVYLLSQLPREREQRRLVGPTRRRRMFNHSRCSHGSVAHAAQTSNLLGGYGIVSKQHCRVWVDTVVVQNARITWNLRA